MTGFGIAGAGRALLQITGALKTFLTRSGGVAGCDGPIWAENLCRPRRLGHHASVCADRDRKATPGQRSALASIANLNGSPISEGAAAID